MQDALNGETKGIKKLTVAVVKKILCLLLPITSVNNIINLQLPLVCWKDCYSGLIDLMVCKRPLAYQDPLKNVQYIRSAH